jgi:ABC-type Zn2+ transport system substrate-binding protein/surface adhesin
MRKYAIVIRKFQRRLNIAISDFLDIGVYGFEDREDFENKEEDDDSKLGVYDPWTRERIRDTKEDENEDEDKEDEDKDSYHSWHRE